MLVCMYAAAVERFHAESSSEERKRRGNGLHRHGMSQSCFSLVIFLDLHRIQTYFVLVSV